jgi:nucleotide-binding universal stress UspA family protein
MKIMATFDGSAFAESTLPLLERLAALPGAEFALFSAADQAHGIRVAEMKRPAQAVGFGGQGSQPMSIPQSEPTLAATKEQATDALLGEVRDYLVHLGSRFPGNAPFTVHVEMDSDPPAAIVRFARRIAPDVIVMATHGHTGLLSRFAGGVTEKVIESGVAPVLVVHPEDVKKARKG